MPNVVDMSDGLRVGRKDGKPYVVRVFNVTALTGATDWEILASALMLYATSAGGAAHTGDDIPKDGSSITVEIESGKPIKMYANEFNVEPWGDFDATVTVGYNTTKRGNFDVWGFGPTIKEVGATAEEEETDFDWENLQKPWNERERIHVLFDPNSGGAPSSSTPYKADPRVRRFAGKPLFTFIREQTTDPEGLSQQYVGWVNADEWRGYAAGTILCVSIVGRDQGTGIWTTTYQFAYSEWGWDQFARWIDPSTGQPPQLTVAMVAAQNGITRVVVQGQKNFAPLQIPT